MAAAAAAAGAGAAGGDGAVSRQGDVEMAEWPSHAVTEPLNRGVTGVWSRLNATRPPAAMLGPRSVCSVVGNRGERRNRTLLSCGTPSPRLAPGFLPGARCRVTRCSLYQLSCRVH